MEQTEIVGFGMVRCLHCGELVNLEGDIHFCDAPKEEWLNKQKEAKMISPNGDVFNLKTKKLEDGSYT